MNQHQSREQRGPKTQPDTRRNGGATVNRYVSRSPRDRKTGKIFLYLYPHSMPVSQLMMRTPQVLKLQTLCYVDQLLSLAGFLLAFRLAQKLAWRPLSITTQT